MPQRSPSRSTAAAAAAIIAALGLSLPSPASARTYTAQAGAQVPQSAPAGTSFNAFLPKKLEVRRGDSVKYLSFGFHTVSVLGRNAEPPPLAVPDPAGGTYQGINDPQGNPFHFNGRAKFIYNPVVFGPVGDLVIDDTGTHNSGVFLPSQDGPGERTLEFERKGTYNVLCLIHPGMKQRVKVLGGKAKGADRPGKVSTAIRKQAAGLLKAARKANNSKVPVSTVFAGVERKQATLLAFKPESLLIEPGTTVSFITPTPSEVHNMVFEGRKQANGTYAAAAYAQQHRDETNFEPTGPGAPNQLAPGYVYGSEPQAVPGAFEYSGDEHGNGFLWTPLMDGVKGDPPNGLLSTERVTFTQPGEYGYFCAIHPEMRGTVTVQP